MFAALLTIMLHFAPNAIGAGWSVYQGGGFNVIPAGSRYDPATSSYVSPQGVRYDYATGRILLSAKHKPRAKSLSHPKQRGKWHL